MGKAVFITSYDIHRSYNQLKAGSERDADGDTLYFTIIDPDGHPLTIIEKLNYSSFKE